MIISIHQIEIDDDNQVHVTALLEDAALIQPQTWEDPAEYGPGLCEAYFTLDKEDIAPSSDYEWIQLLEDLDLTWELVDNEDDYYNEGLTY